MSLTPGVQVSSAVRIVYSSPPPEARLLAPDGLVLSISMQQDLLGAQGEPAVQVVMVDLASIRHAGSSTWADATHKIFNLVHRSHIDFREGRVTMAYEEIPAIDRLRMITDAARIAHEVNRIHCLASGDAPQPVWSDAPQWQQSSAENGVAHILKDPEISPEESHHSWLAEKVANGWTYGPVKNPETKEHPCLKPYAALSSDQRAKDYFFGAVVRAYFKLAQIPVDLADIRPAPSPEPQPLTPSRSRRAATAPLPPDPPAPQEQPAQ